MTKYLLRGPLGYVAGPKEPSDWTQFDERAYWYTTSEAAHTAKRRWFDIHRQTLTVIVRDSDHLTPSGYLIHGPS
jgi:hypothetical protein